MASILRYLFGSCLLSNVEPQPSEDVTTDDPIIENIHFIVPLEDYEKFTEMELDEKCLNVSEYMFLFRYAKHVEQINAPGPDYTKASYLFRDGIVTFVLKGWVPTKASPKSDQVGDGASRFQDARSYIIHAGVPRRKSAYNWGVINTWSRQCADTSEDNVLIELVSHTRPSLFNPDFVPYGPFTQVSDRTNTVQADDSAYHRVGSCVAVTPTLDTRDRRLRPKAAKGRRTRNC